MRKNIFQNKIGKAFAVVAVAGIVLSGNGMPWIATDAYAAVDLTQIPEYTGSPYTVINDNEPEFEADDFSTEAFENYSELDDLGRCGVAYANICHEIMPTEKRGAIGMVKPSGWHTVKYPELIKDRYLYNRCHLIGFQLAGENANTKNLITGTRYLNVEGMLPFEDEVADYVKETDNHVLYRVTPVFDGDNLVASGVQMEAESVEDDGAGVKFNVYCYNVQPGIGIDYATGDSWVDAGNAVIDGTDTDNAEQTEFAINTNTGKFHKPDCKSVKKMKAKNKEEFNGSRDELIAEGYEPCGSCRP